MEVSINIKGLQDLATTLERDLPEAMAKGVIRDALRAGAEVVQDAAEQSAAEHHRTGAMEEDIGIAVRVKNDRSLHGFALVGALYEGEGTDDPGVYSKFVEEGHAPPGKGREKAAAARRGIELEFGGKDTPPHPWLRPAWEGSKDQALEAIIESLKDGIEAAAKSVNK